MADSSSSSNNMKIFWACFVALVATSFVFGVRSELVAGAIGTEFGLSEGDKGRILGVGLWPFALSIIGFSLIIDRIGYKATALFAIVCHILSLVLTLLATKDNNLLYWGTFVVALANGAVEAFINPVIATIFNKNKAKWLNILHAGWPLGIALGVIFSKLLGEGVEWQVKFGICFVPVVVYAALVILNRFPVNERVAAGVSYADMLKQVGAIGFFIIGILVSMGIVQVAAMSTDWAVTPTRNFTIGLIVGTLAAILGGLYTRSLGNPLFLVVLVTMPFLATTELGTDTWMPGLLQVDFGTGAAWVLAYSAIIMTILRCYAGPIVHKFSPIGLLVISAIVAIVGLLFFSFATGKGVLLVLLAATVYAFGKTFLWSTTLGMVAEQFPKGGALTLNGVSGVGVLGMGLVGSVLMGQIQDKKIDADLRSEHPAIHQGIAAAPEPTLFGHTPKIDSEKVESLSKTDEQTLIEIQNRHKKGTFARIALLPTFMLLCYLGIFFYFKGKGGYKPVKLDEG